MNKRHKNRRADNFSRKWQLGRLIFLYYRKCAAILISKQQVLDVGGSGIRGMSCAVFVGNWAMSMWRMGREAIGPKSNIKAHRLFDIKPITFSTNFDSMTHKENL
jgi:hypothetical protein